MSSHFRSIALITLLIACMALLPLFLGPPSSAHAPESGLKPMGLPELSFTVPLTDTLYIYMPYVPVNMGPAVELQWLQTANSDGDLRAAFATGEMFTYTLTANNNLSFPLEINLWLSHLGPCGETAVYHGLLTLPPGISHSSIPAAGETCEGIYVASADFDSKFLTGIIQNTFVVNPASTVSVNQFHGFDACHPPTVAEMQDWWNDSPYAVYNLYLGGSLFACDDEPLDPFWVHQVAGQGWEFILSWVGPQAPCTGFRERMSGDPIVAYQEGRAEAALAVEAADQLGLLGDRVIYYDVEGYASATMSCRNAVSSFLEGWTDQLHDLGLRAGAYGGACSSYLTDWAFNSPPPDDVWVAHWSFSEYDTEATVWDAPCVSNNFWTDHQRIKQYAGGHNETWGTTTINIDSDVLDGEVTTLPFGASGQSGETVTAAVTSYGTPWRDLGLFGPSQGWVRTDDRVWVTDSVGEAWTEVSPDFNRLLDVAFLDPDRVWAVGFHSASGGLSLAQSVDGGVSWIYNPLSTTTEGGSPVAAAVLDVPAADQVRVVLKRVSGSNFNLGESQVTQDGGRTWTVEQAPSLTAVILAAEVRAGLDGDGALPFDHPSGAIAADYLGERYGWAIVQIGGCVGEKGSDVGVSCVRSWQLLSTDDAGITWVEISPW